MKLTKEEEEQVDIGLEVTFMHLREILKNPKMIDKYSKTDSFVPIYLKDGKREALLLRIRSKKATG